MAGVGTTLFLNAGGTDTNRRLLKNKPSWTKWVIFQANFYYTQATLIVPVVSTSIKTISHDISGTTFYTYVGGFTPTKTAGNNTDYTFHFYTTGYLTNGSSYAVRLNNANYWLTGKMYWLGF